MDKSHKTMVSRHDFGKDFAFGAASSAYQIEGAWNVDGKGMSIWDFYTLKEPGIVEDGSNGCVAIEHYNFFKEDVALMKKIGLDSYRFSISWTRILPGGRLSNGLSKEGIKFYNDLIDELVAAGIKPFVTLFHWDIPQCLEEEYGGFLSDKIVKDYCEFAEVCFWNYGDRVKHWITLNEPAYFASQGYAEGTWPPCRGKISEEDVQHRILAHRNIAQPFVTSKEGNPSTEPYIVAHNLIISHAAAVKIYREKYKATQNGKIGMTNVAMWYEPLNDSQEDETAASRAFDFLLGWFVEPMMTGQYPQTMINNVGYRLPRFTEEQSQMVKGSYDFLGVNYYTARYVTNRTKSAPPSYTNDSNVTISTTTSHGIPIGDLAPGTIWLYVYPQGIYKLLMKMKKIYGGNKDDEPVIYITENGTTDKNDKKKTISDYLPDKDRIKYHSMHLLNIKKAMDDGVNVKGYFIWSLFDSFEWNSGYTVRFGIFYVDYLKGYFTRYPKNSAIWYMNFLEPTEQKPPSGLTSGEGQQKLLTEQPEETPEESQGSQKRQRNS
ncbi:beta-glucosidase-like [Olea europaea var. sylvestris]|uniref:beta-glucosidase-like n=1 Tax=Olea europaea var. sylvestris TaxID=158386 RepID=UPI000C1D2C23|nr:beta-glucosidase-like [Olea europaea var. sylvestris]